MTPMKSKVRSAFVVLWPIVFSAPLLADNVILLHGLARSDRSMQKLAAALEQQGFCVQNVEYASTKADIATLAEAAIGPALQQCATSEPVHFVTHSMGGILVPSSRPASPLMK